MKKLENMSCGIAGCPSFSPWGEKKEQLAEKENQHKTETGIMRKGRKSQGSWVVVLRQSPLQISLIT